MKSSLRVLFYVACVALWVCCVWGGLELHHRFAWNRIEKNNPFVRSRLDALPWPETAPVAFPEGIIHVDSDSAPRRSASPLPETDPVEEFARRATFFLSLDEGDRAAFAQAYLQNILWVNDQGMVTKSYPPGQVAETPLTECNGWVAGGQLPVWVESALDSGLPELHDADEAAASSRATRAFIFPVPKAVDQGGGAVVFLDLREPRERIPADSIYELPFFVFRKHARLEHQPFETNNIGFRDDDVMLPKPDGVYRIVCIGGSTTEEGDNNADTYPNRLERKLNAFYGTDRIDVVNCGISGLNSATEKMRLPDFLAIEPDLIVYYNGINDICHRMFLEWVNSASGWRSVVRDSQCINYHLNHCLVPDDAQVMADLERITFSNLRFLHDRAAASGIPMAFCTFARPDIERLSQADRDYYDYYNNLEWGGRYVTFATYCRVLDIFNEQLRALCKDQGAPCFPVAEHIRGGTYYFGDLCHMKNEGIDLKADIVLTFIHEHFSEAIRARTGALELDSES